MNDDPKYYDQDGRECSLQTLCTREPGWAASRIRTMRTALEESERAASLNAHALNLCSDEKLAAWREIEELKRQRDEARGLLKRARPIVTWMLDTDPDAVGVVNDIDNHLRDTGE